jgi:hypothetical protein
MLHCSTSYLRKLVSLRVIPSAKIGRKVLFSDDHLRSAVQHFERRAVKR